MVKFEPKMLDIPDEEIRYSHENGILALMPLSHCLMYAFSKILTEDNFKDEDNKKMFTFLKEKTLSQRYKQYIHKTDMARIDSVTKAINDGTTNADDFTHITTTSTNIIEYLCMNISPLNYMLKKIALNEKDNLNLEKNIELFTGFCEAIYTCLNRQYPIGVYPCSLVCRLDAIIKVQTIAHEVGKYYCAIMLRNPNKQEGK